MRGKRRYQTFRATDVPAPLRIEHSKIHFEQVYKHVTSALLTNLWPGRGFLCQTSNVIGSDHGFCISPLQKQEARVGFATFVILLRQTFLPRPPGYVGCVVCRKHAQYDSVCLLLSDAANRRPRAFVILALRAALVLTVVEPLRATPPFNTFPRRSMPSVICYTGLKTNMEPSSPSRSSLFHHSRVCKAVSLGTELDCGSPESALVEFKFGRP